MRSYIDMLGEAVAPVRAATGTTDAIVAKAVSPAIDPKLSPITWKDLAFTVTGALAGMHFYKKHPYLGFVGGAAIGSAVEPMMRNYGSDRKDAAYRLGIAAAGIGASLAYKKHPAAGYAIGAVAAVAITTQIKGSPMQRLIAEHKKAA